MSADRPNADAWALPPGLLEELRADALPHVRPAELARVRALLEVLSLDEPEVLEGIAAGLLDVATS